MVCEGPNCKTVAHHRCIGLINPPSGDWYCEECEGKMNNYRQPKNGNKHKIKRVIDDEESSIDDR